MQALSAADAVTPAVHRTKDYLFRPFKLGTYLKLCLIAVMTEGLGGNFNSSMPGGGSRAHGHNPSNPNPSATLHHISPELIAMIVAGIALGIVVAIAIYYLINRLRFAFFHCLIRQTKEIALGWHLYRNQASRFFQLSLAIGIIFILMVAVIALPFVIGFVRVFHSSGGHPDVLRLLSYFLPLIPIIILAVLIGITIQLVLRDFMMPHMALENLSAGQAWAAVRERIVAEKGNFFVYALLRIAIPIVGLMALFMVLLIPGLVLLGGTALVFVALHSAFAHAVGGVAAVGILLEVVVGIVAFCILAFIGVFFGGPLSVWVRNYALMFYGGRYQVLGDILAPPLAGGVPLPSA